MAPIRTRGSISSRALSLALTALACVHANATTLWQTPWLADAPFPWVTGGNGDSPKLAGVGFAEDGDMVFASNSAYLVGGEIVARFGADGTLRWGGEVEAFDDPAAVVPLADGGAYVTFSFDGIVGTAGRIDANGRSLWMRDLPARALEPIDDTHVAIADCSSVSMLDAATGDVLWNRALANSTACDGGLVADASTLYSIATLGWPTPGVHIVALDLDGRVRWNVTPDLGADAALVGGSNGQLYVHSNGETFAIRAADGSIAWRAPGSGWILGGAAREPIVVTQEGIQRLAADDGHVRWTAAANSYFGPIAAVSDSIVAVAATTVEQVVRIDAESGTVLWSIDLPAITPGVWHEWSAIGGRAPDGTFPVVASTGASTFVQRVDYATGALALAAPMPPVNQAVSGNAVRDGEEVVSLHSDYSDEVRLIDVDASTGATRWNVSVPTAIDSIFVGPYLTQGGPAVGPSRVAAAIPMNTSPDTGGYVEVVALDRASGVVAWNVTLLDDGGERDTSVAMPIVDAAGNVVVSVLMQAPYQDGSIQPKRSIYKLAALDGTVLWRFDDRAPTDQAFEIRALGNDVLVRGRFENSTSTLRRLDGDDGSVQWSSDVFADAGVLTLYFEGTSKIVAFAMPTDAYAWAGLDPTSGAVLWSSTAPCPEGAFCGGFNGALAPNGDVVLPIVSDANVALVRLAGNGSGAVTTWPIAPADPVLQSSASVVGFESDGTIDFDWGQYGSWMSGGGWFARLDTASGISSFQSVVGYPMSVPDGTKLLLDRATAYAREDITVTAHGNLAASVTLDQREISPGEHLGFHLIATYAGDAPLAGVSLRGRMRWPSGATDLVCGGPGISNCVLDATSDDVVATFDIAPGGRLEITGKILALDDPGVGDDARYIGALVLGPAGLVETNTTDNFARTSAQQVLFANGFDG